MPTASFPSRILACALLASAGLRAEPAVIGLARAYLGPDSTLDGITTIHFVGTLERTNPDHPEVGPIHASLDMLFSRPYRQRQVVRTARVTDVTVLDGYDAWDRVVDNTDPTKFRLKWLSANDITSLRANSWENLHFFRGLDDGATAVDQGPSTVDGIACERVDFIHGPADTFERFFDRDTGKLVLTVKSGESIRENGEIVVDGIKFPKEIVSTAKTPSGKDVITTVTFDSVVLNEAIRPDLFGAPNLIPDKAPAPAVAAPGK
jgi:hypothetical protein